MVPSAEVVAADGVEPSVGEWVNKRRKVFEYIPRPRSLIPSLPMVVSVETIPFTGDVVKPQRGGPVISFPGMPQTLAQDVGGEHPSWGDSALFNLNRLL